MIDVRRLRSDLDAVRAALGRKGVDPAEVDAAAAADARLVDLTGRRDQLRAEVNRLSKEVGTAKRAGDEAAAERAATESRALGGQLQQLEQDAGATEAELRDRLLRLPNLPSPDAPDGASEADNVVVRTEGAITAADYAEHQKVPHWEIGEHLGILDLARGAKVCGSLFVFLRGQGAALSRALCQLALDRNADAFEEIRPPTLVRTDTMVATGQLPKFADDAYQIERDDLWAIPTAEVPLTSIGRDEVLAEADLPMRLMAYSPCYRREAGAAGRDTRGLLRVHEFDKVELLAYTTPDQAPAMHAEIMDRAEQLIASLGLGYRWLEICAADLGQSHYRQYDLEVYAPGADMWLEVSSVSWFTDYQARRANIRYKPTQGGGTAFVHTLNGSALAVPRVWATVVEVNRQVDGTVAIPEALQPYMRGATAITP
ncbi:MAG: seryl-tRNA synthetase [Actinomycetota bacterium]